MNRGAAHNHPRELKSHIKASVLITSLCLSLCIIGWAKISSAIYVLINFYIAQLSAVNPQSTWVQEILLGQPSSTMAAIRGYKHTS
jgi:hypothetical protein